MTDFFRRPFWPSAACGSNCLRAVLCAVLFGATVPLAGAAELFDEVVRQARTAAQAAYQPNDSALPLLLRKLNYDSYRDINFRRERSLWHKGNEPFEVQFFPPGYLFTHPVTLHEVVGDQVRPLPFNPNYFRYPDLDPAPFREDGALGFAGFRVLYPLNDRAKLDEVISFLGSNYFRALAAGQIYGLSARGVAIDTGENLTEEFPEFREFWLYRPEAKSRVIKIVARLDGRSVTGAYRFVVRPGKETVVEVKARLFFRRAVTVVGLAPLTSMFWRGENESPPPNDKRPEVHDSDGLLIGAHDWHPLHPVAQVKTEIFPQDGAPSFALLQRDRAPAHYRDREAHYERRPSLRVEPLGDWGRGAIHLVQLPTANEYNDNVVVFWQPEKTPAAGDEIVCKYRLHWFTQESNKP